MTQLIETTQIQPIQLSLILPAPTTRYRIRSTTHSSARFGPCEVCKQHTSEVFIQVEETLSAAKDYDDCGDIWFESGSLFGHKECLEAQQN